MSGRLGLEIAPVLYAGLPLLVLLLLLWERRLRRDALAMGPRLALVALRGLAGATLLVLLARPFSVREGDARDRRTVVVLVDRSRSMGLAEDGPTRYQQALGHARALVPALQNEGLTVETKAFDAAVAPLDLANEAPPAGDLTDLGGAFLQTALGAEPPPLALIALTDGAANHTESNQGALLALLQTRTPVLAVGFGRDGGVPSLSLRRLSAPPRVPPRQTFRVSAQLHSSGGPLPEFDLLLLRDGALAQTRRVAADRNTAGRVWSEGFDLVEDKDGLHEYAVQLRLPPEPKLVSVNTRTSVPVRIGKEKEFRILYVQGALAWDFKFIGRALRGDPAIRVTGLSRTSQQSVFRQNVETAGELASGFPKDLAEIAPYRVLVMSELKAGDLTPAQQDLVARFCGELGGGVLMIGGQSTFDESWRGSRLEQLLPVTLDSSGVSGLDRPFRLRLTDDARRSAMFTVAGDGAESAKAWSALPTFSGYGRLAQEKRGATVWARHEDDLGPEGKRILIASHAYGAGVASVIAVQNFWRWRLAKESDPQTFDRFWQQFLRFLGQSGSQEFQIQFLDQELRTGTDIRALVEKHPRPEGSGAADTSKIEYRVRVRGPRGADVLDQKAALTPLRPIEIRFRAQEPGVYTAMVELAAGVTLASQPIEILDLDREMERTGRDMEGLRQWAAATQGAALPAEECPDPSNVVSRLKAQVDALRKSPARRRPVGVNAPVMVWLLACLGGEWALRKKWGLR